MTNIRSTLSNERRGIFGFKDGRPYLYDADVIDRQIRKEFANNPTERQILLNLLDDCSTANGGW